MEVDAQIVEAEREATTIIDAARTIVNSALPPLKMLGLLYILLD